MGWAKLQNNECVIEGFISSADNQSFDNQKDKTLEDRLIVKCKSDTFVSTREISQDIAEMSTVGNEKMEYSKSDFTDHLGEDHVRIYEIKRVIKTFIHLSDVESQIQTRIKIIAQNYK